MSQSQHHYVMSLFIGPQVVFMQLTKLAAADCSRNILHFHCLFKVNATSALEWG